MDPIIKRLLESIDGLHALSKDNHFVRLHVSDDLPAMKDDQAEVEVTLYREVYDGPTMTKGIQEIAEQSCRIPRHDSARSEAFGQAVRRAFEQKVAQSDSGVSRPQDLAPFGWLDVQPMPSVDDMTAGILHPNSPPLFLAKLRVTDFAKDKGLPLPTDDDDFYAIDRFLFLEPENWKTRSAVLRPERRKIVQAAVEDSRRDVVWYVVSALGGGHIAEDEDAEDAASELELLQLVTPFLRNPPNPWNDPDERSESLRRLNDEASEAYINPEFKRAMDRCREYLAKNLDGLNAVSKDGCTVRLGVSANARKHSATFIEDEDGFRTLSSFDLALSVEILAPEGGSVYLEDVGVDLRSYDDDQGHMFVQGVRLGFPERVAQNDYRHAPPTPHDFVPVEWLDSNNNGKIDAAEDVAAAIAGNVSIRESKIRNFAKRHGLAIPTAEEDVQEIFQFIFQLQSDRGRIWSVREAMKRSRVDVVKYMLAYLSSRTPLDSIKSDKDRAAAESELLALRPNLSEFLATQIGPRPKSHRTKRA